MSSLGALQAEYKENTQTMVTTGLIGIGCIAFGLVMLYYFWFGMTRESWFNQILFVIGGLCALVGGISCVITYFQNRGGRVAIHENGVLIERKGKTLAATWDEIASVTESVEKMHMNGQYVYDRYLYTIEKTNGETMAVNNLVSDVKRFGETVKRNTFARLYPQAVAKLDAGGNVSFGPLNLSADGLEAPGAKFTWSELSAVEIEGGQIEVKDRDGRSAFRGNWAATPNAHLFVGLVQNYLPVQ
ncbi:MAG: DUF6585 family protein [Pyrinomonadaceae bacterium]